MEESGQAADGAFDVRIIKATKDLRMRLKLSQTAFGQQINRTMNTVLTYESKTAPKGEALVPYAALALDSGFDDLAQLFRSALIKDLGPDCMRVLGSKPDADGSLTPELRTLVKAFLKFMRSRDLLPAEILARDVLQGLLLRNFSRVGEKNRKRS